VGRIADHAFIFATLFLGIYSQLVIRWQVGLAGGLPDTIEGKCLFILRLLFTPWVISAMAATFLSGVSWMLTMTKFEVSYAYPWLSLNFVIMLICGVVLFNEHFSMTKLVGTLFVICGIIILSRS